MSCTTKTTGCKRFHMRLYPYPHTILMVSEVHCVVMEGVDTAHIALLRKLVDAAIAWTTSEFDALRETIRNDLMTRGYNTLIALNAPTAKTPTTGSIGHARQN
jgi:hypothetical protein